MTMDCSTVHMLREKVRYLEGLHAKTLDGSIAKDMKMDEMRRAYDARVEELKRALSDVVAEVDRVEAFGYDTALDNIKLIALKGIGGLK